MFWTFRKKQVTRLLAEIKVLERRNEALEYQLLAVKKQVATLSNTTSTSVASYASRPKQRRDNDRGHDAPYVAAAVAMSMDSGSCGGGSSSSSDSGSSSCSSSSSYD